MCVSAIYLRMFAHNVIFAMCALCNAGRCSNVEQLKNDVVEYAQMEAEMERTTSALREIQAQVS